MKAVIIEKAIDMFKSISELCKKVIDASDPENYAKSVEELNKGVSDTYNEMRKIIINSENFNEEEKLKKLSELAKHEEASKQKCGEAIKGNRENVAKISLEILKGFLTCGIYFMPSIVKSLKNAIADEKDISKIESEILIDDIIVEQEIFEQT